MPKVKRTKARGADGEQPYGVRFDCPGCNETHVLPTKPESPSGWEFNGDLERPTLAPSILVHACVAKDGRELTPRCHSYVRDGKIEFLADCTHALRGQTVELPECGEHIK